MDIVSDKRAISPLAATIILIVISVLLGAVVMSWGETYIQERADFVKGVTDVGSGCDSVRISVISIDKRAQVCTRTDRIELQLENGAVAVPEIHARIVGSSETFTYEQVLSAPMAKESAQKVVIPLKNAGSPRQLKLTPKVGIKGSVQSCEKQALLIESIPTCT